MVLSSSRGITPQMVRVTLTCLPHHHPLHINMDMDHTVMVLTHHPLCMVEGTHHPHINNIWNKDNQGMEVVPITPHHILKVVRTNSGMNLE